jgi:hypothetical protein
VGKPIQWWRNCSSPPPLAISTKLIHMHFHRPNPQALVSNGQVDVLAFQGTPRRSHNGEPGIWVKPGRAHRPDVLRSSVPAIDNWLFEGTVSPPILGVAYSRSAIHRWFAKREGLDG